MIRSLIQKIKVVFSVLSILCRKYFKLFTKRERKAAIFAVVLNVQTGEGKDGKDAARAGV